MLNSSTKNLNTIYETDVEKVNKVFKKEWEKAVANLISSTPPGQIRFTLINFTKLCRKVESKVKVNNVEKILESCLANNASAEKLALTYSFNNFPPYESEAKLMDMSLSDGLLPKYRLCIAFYANKPNSNPNCAEDLISHWFDNFVFPDFKKRKNAPTPPGMPLFASSFFKTYSYAPILFALTHFGYHFTKEEYEAMFWKMCAKSRCRLYTLHAEPSNTLTLI